MMATAASMEVIDLITQYLHDMLVHPPEEFGPEHKCIFARLDQANEPGINEGFD